MTAINVISIINDIINLSQKHDCQKKHNIIILQNVNTSLDSKYTQTIYETTIILCLPKDNWPVSSTLST